MLPTYRTAWCTLPFSLKCLYPSCQPVKMCPLPQQPLSLASLTCTFLQGSHQLHNALLPFKLFSAHGKEGEPEVNHHTFQVSFWPQSSVIQPSSALNTFLLDEFGHQQRCWWSCSHQFKPLVRPFGLPSFMASKLPVLHNHAMNECLGSQKDRVTARPSKHHFIMSGGRWSYSMIISVIFTQLWLTNSVRGAFGWDTILHNSGHFTWSK